MKEDGDESRIIGLVQALRLILSIVLIPLMLLSTTGVRLSQHWCGDELVNATIWGEAEACDHFNEEAAPVCPMHAHLAVKKKCCKQKSTIVEGGDEDYEIISHVLKIKFKIISNYTWIFMPLKAVEYKLDTDSFFNHSPPLLKEEVLTLFQLFLI